MKPFALVSSSGILVYQLQVAEFIGQHHKANVSLVGAEQSAWDITLNVQTRAINGNLITE